MFKRLMILVAALALMVGVGAVTAAQAANDIHGDMTYRWNGFDNNDQNSDIDDAQAYAQMLTEITFGGSVNSSGSYLITLENYRVFGDETSDRNQIYQATFTVDDFLFNDFDLTFGRMPVAYGRERIIGMNSWDLDPAARAVFEGCHIRYGFDGGWLDHFNFKVAETYDSKYTEAKSGIGDTNLTGFYMHYDANENFWFEPYAILMTQENYASPTDLDNDKQFTYGALVDYAREGLHFYGEATVQTGTSYGVGTETDTSALAWYAGLFYDFDSSVEPFIGFEYNFASGEDGATDEMDAFGSIAGSSRDYLGIMDIVGWTDVTAMRFAGGFTPTTGLDVTLDYYIFAADQVADGIDDAIGTELDLQLGYALNEDVNLHGGMGLFMYDEPAATTKSGAYAAPGDGMMFTWIGASIGF